MICTKCKAELVQSTNFCPNCGKKLVHSTKKRRAKSRGNGTGCAYYDSVHRYWVAQIVDGYRELPPFSLDNPDNRKQMVPIKRTKGGFKKREDALAYCSVLKNGHQKPVLAPTLTEYWSAFKDGKYAALSPSKQQAYRTAWKKLESISNASIDQLTVHDLQNLVSEKCSSYYTARDVKTLLTRLYEIAAADGYARAEVPSFIVLTQLN